MKEPIAIEILKKITPKIGARLIIEPNYQFVGQIIFKNGKKTFFRNTNFNINHLGSIEIARDKDYSKFFLKKFGYNTCVGEAFFSEKLNSNLRQDKRKNIDDGLVYAKKIGFPIIVKPNNLSQGTLVTKVHNAKEYYRAANKIFKKTLVMLIEKYYKGFDYRIVVLDDKVISAYQRIPLFIIGDSKSSIKELLDKKQEDFRKKDRDTVIDQDDFRLKNRLKRLHLNSDSILKKNEKIFLLDNSNLSTGGDAFDLTEKIHPDFMKLAVKVTKDMGLRFCGVDLISAEEITEPVKDHVIVEINGAPGLDNYARIGKEQNKIVENLYLELLKALEKD